MHPQEQQLEGWGGRNLQSDSAWGKGRSKGREFGHVRRRKDDGTGREGGCRHTGQLGHEGAHPATRAGKGRGSAGDTDGRREREREGGGLVTIARGGFHGARRRGGRHHRGDETSRGAAPPRQHPGIHRCDAARVLTRATPRRRRGRAWRRGRRRSARAPPPPRRPPTLRASPRARHARRRRGSIPPPRH